jgi:hypothetical protein
MSPETFAGLRRELADDDVLSVYISAQEHDPTERTSWRTRLRRELDEAERSLPGDAAEAFTAARRRVEAALNEFTGFLPGRGWVAFATATRLVHCEEEPAAMPDMVRWRRGPVLGPLMRAVKQSRPVRVALIDSRRARLLTYHEGELEEPHDLRADAFIDDLTDGNMSKRAATTTGTRGETASDAADRILRTELDRLAREVAREMTADGADDIAVLGGPTQAVAALEKLLAPTFGPRLYVDESMHLTMSLPQLRPLVEAAASALSERLHGNAAQAVIEDAAPGGLGALGIDAALQGCTIGQVERVYITPTVLTRSEDRAEELIARTLEQGGAIELVSGPAAELLDERAGGVGARLRFTRTAPRTERDAAIQGA